MIENSTNININDFWAQYQYYNQIITNTQFDLDNIIHHLKASVRGPPWGKLPKLPNNNTNYNKKKLVEINNLLTRLLSILHYQNNNLFRLLTSNPNDDNIDINIDDNE